MEKIIELGEIGSLTIGESAGQASLKFYFEKAVGGGAAAGVLKAKASVELDLGAQQAADLALALLAAHFPSASGLIEGLKLEVDAVLSASK